MIFNRHKSINLFGIAGTALLLFLLAGYILFPALKTIEQSLTSNGVFSIANFVEIFSSEITLTPIKNSINLAILTVLVCGIIGTSLAFFVNYFDFPFRKYIDKLLYLPVMLPGIIIVFSFVQLYGESGLVTKTLELIPGVEKAPYSFSGLSGILFVHAYTQYVYFYISVSIAIKYIDYSVVESARSLGASDYKIFTTIIIPYIKPALITSSVLTFMTGIGSFTAPMIIGGRFKVLTTQILLSKANNFMEIASAQVVILSMISLTFYWLFNNYEKKRQFVSSVKGVPIRPVKIENRFSRALLIVACLLLVLSVLLPVITIVFLSFVKPGTWMVNIYPDRFSLENYIQIFTKTRSLSPFLNSISMALISAFFCLVIAVPSSYIIVKTRTRTRLIVEFLVMLPWTMPASAIAINIINAYNEPNIFAFDSVLVGTYILLPMGYFIRSIPIFVKAANISFQNLSDTLTEASKSLGASEMVTFRKISLITISPGLVAGFLLVFIRSIGEYNISAFLYTVSNKPVSIAMVNGIFEYNIGLAMAYGSLLILITFVLSLIIRKFTPDVV